MTEQTVLSLEKIERVYESPDTEGGLTILSGLDLKVKAGDTVAIVGPSGSGKSTLLNIIGTLDRPTAGKVLLDEQDLSELDSEALAELRLQKIGFVFQQHHLLPQCSVLENVLLPTLPLPVDPKQTKERAEELLRKVGLGERLNHMPGQLSGGECQRVAVVRSMINNPKLLLADEPTGSLDRQHGNDLAGLLLSLNESEQLTMIVVTHSEELAARMKRQLHLVEGKLKEV